MKKKIDKLILLFFISLNSCSETVPDSVKKLSNKTLPSEQMESLQNEPTKEQMNYLISKENPKWSPNGDKLIFEFQDALYIVNSDGSNRNLIYDPNPNPKSYFKPIRSIDSYNIKWSPNGKKILFTVFFNSKENNSKHLGFSLYTINPDGSGLNKLASDSIISNPTWLPDGERIILFYNELNQKLNNYFDGDFENSNIFLMNSDGTNKINLTENIRKLLDTKDMNLIQYFDISSDGKSLIVCISTKIFLIDIKTKNISFLHEAPSELFNYLYFSPNNKKILFSFSRNFIIGKDDKIESETLGFFRSPTRGPVREVFVMDVDGGNLNKFIKYLYPDSPKWSYDGKRIAYTTDVVHIINTKDFSEESSFAEPLEKQIDGIDWSPDSTKLSFSTSHGNFIKDFNSQKILKIGDNVSIYKNLEWSINGKNLASPYFLFNTNGQEPIPLNLNKKIQ